MAEIDAAKIKQLDGSLLLVLQELLRQRRVTLAAQRLGLSQSAVSHALARLRELFGDPLFVRKAYGLEPTRHALELGPRIEALLCAMQDAMGLPAHFEPAETTRSFRIGIPDYLAALLGPTLITSFASCAPRARLSFNQWLGSDAQRALLRDELDLAIGRFGAAQDGLALTPLFEDRYCVVARRDHPLLRRKLEADGLAELSLVQVSVLGDFRIPAFIPLEAAASMPRVVASVPRFSLALSLVAESDAVTIVPECIARRHARPLGLRVHPLPFRLEPIAIFAAHRVQPDAGTRFLLDQARRAVDQTARPLRAATVVS
jgi:DNA-binding transcriptional LysR family regulator